MAKECEHLILNVEDIKLDLSNPRIARFLAHQEEVTAEDVAMALGVGSPDTANDGGTTFHSLRESIRTNRGIIQPIIVNEMPPGTYTVIEGNTRVAIYKELEEDDEGNWITIPAVVYQDLGDEQIDAIRLQAHLIGPRAWDPYSKAKYLHFLRTQEHMPYGKLVDYCGGRASEVKQLIQAYIDMEKYYRPIIDEDADFDETRFSAFKELQNGRIRGGIEKAGHSLAEFAQWVHDGKVMPTHLMRKLPQVLENETAKTTFFDMGLREAVRLVEVPNTDNLIENIDLITLCAALRRKVQSMPLIETQRIQENPECDLATELMLVNSVLRKSCKTIFGQDSDFDE